MSRTHARSDGREAQVAAVAFDALDAIDIDGRLLVVGDLDGHLEAALTDVGQPVDRWCRVSRGDRAGTAWPTPGMRAGAALRLPKARSSMEMAVHAIGAHLPPGSPLWVYGANDEGIRSAGKRLGPLFDDVSTLETRRKCRIWQAKRTDAPARAPLSAWHTTTRLAVPGSDIELDWTELPGVFAAGRFDEASAALVRAMTPVRPDARILDFGCGAGFVSAMIARRYPGAELHLLDADAVALEAAKINVPGAKTYLGDGWAAVPGLKVDHIISNPPIHRGKGEDFAVLESLIADASRHMGRRRRLELVVQRQVPVRRWLEASFGRVEVTFEDSRFRVWSAR